MQAHPVAHVNQISVTWTNTVNNTERLLQAHVGDVLSRPQRVNDQQGHAFEALDDSIIDGLGIGDISQRSNAVPVDGEPVMIHRQRLYTHALDEERIVIDDMLLEMRNAGIRVIGKAIWDALMQVAHHVGTGIQRHGTLKAVGTQVIKARHMIKMDVRQQDGIDIVVAGAQHLGAEVGAAVNQEPCPLIPYNR